MMDSWVYIEDAEDVAAGLPHGAEWRQTEPHEHHFTRIRRLHTGYGHPPWSEGCWCGARRRWVEGEAEPVVWDGRP